jgi:hypothetical protein
MLDLVGWFVVIALGLALAVGRFLLPETAHRYTPRKVGRRALRVVARHPGPLGFLLLVGVLHQVAVYLDPWASTWVQSTTGLEFTKLVVALEGNLVATVVNFHWTPLTTAFVYFYLVFHAFMMIFGPAFVLLTERGRLARTAILLYPCVYLLALPTLLFFPALNPNVYYGFPSPLEAVIPGSSALFYKFTTVDNTLPSLHVGAALAIGQLAWATGNRRFRALASVYAVGVPLAVIYLPFHWLVDVVGGVVVGVAGYRLAHHLAGHDALEAPDLREQIRGAIARWRARRWRRK